MLHSLNQRNLLSKRSIFPQFGLLIFLVIIAVFIIPTSVARAAEIVVDTTEDNTNEDEQCSLREAITNTNDDFTTYADCSPIDIYGDDTITFFFTTPSTITLGVDLEDLVIEDNLTITGLGASSTIIDRGWTSGITDTLRIFYVNNGITLSISNVTLQNGHAEGENFPTSSDNGGAIYNNGTLNITASIITNNSAGTPANTNVGYGGAIFNNGGTVNIENSTFYNNYSAHRGGGIANEGAGILNVTNSIFSDNDSSYGGGINLFNDLASASIVNSTFSGNSATSSGGGLNIYRGSATVVNSTFSNNNGPGAGIASRGPLTITNSTIYSNTSTSTYGSVYEYGSNTITITNSIVANDLGAANCAGTIFDGGYNLEDAAECFSDPTSIINTNPNLAPLANNGGPTLTHALQSNSLAAIDAIPSANCIVSPVNGIDQRGASRNFNGDESGSGDCDIGAYEMREFIMWGTCSTGALLDGEHTFGFLNGTSVQIDIDGSSNADLRCITVEEMGPGVSHLLATETSDGGEAIQTNNWWHISGDGTDFNIAIALPFSRADSNSRVCKWPGKLGGYGWDCGDNSNTSIPEVGFVRRSNISSFSDWTVGDYVGPTVLTLSSFDDQSNPALLWFIISLIFICFLFIFNLRYFKRRTNS